MGAILDGIDIETIRNIVEYQSPTINQIPLTYDSLQLAQHLKATRHSYEVSAIWSGGATDYTNKKRKVQNIVDSGLPVWFEAVNFGTNQIIFGKIANFVATLSEGRVDAYDINFTVIGVHGWGYVFITDDGAGSFVIYDVDKVVQSRNLNPILRRCNIVKTNTTPTTGTITFSFFVKNLGSTGTVKIEMFVPDGMATGSITATSSQGGAITKAAGDVGAGGISTKAGTKRRITLSKSVIGGAEEQWDITISYTATKTSYLDGSSDDTVP